MVTNLLSDSGFTNTLWSTGYYSPVQTVGSTYVRNMNTWAIYASLNTQQYRAFETTFDVWTDMTPGASVGWAASIDGQTFCGQVESVRNSLVWLHRQPLTCLSTVRRT